MTNAHCAICTACIIHKAHTLQFAIQSAKKKTEHKTTTDSWAETRGESIQSVRQQIVRTPWTPIQASTHLSKAPGGNLWVAASIVFLSVDGSVSFPIRINSISMSDRERAKQKQKPTTGLSQMFFKFIQILSHVTSTSTHSTKHQHHSCVRAKAQSATHIKAKH